MESESTEGQADRVRLVSQLVSDCQSLASERVERYLRARHHGIVADTPFAPASAECIELFRDGHYYGAISLSQAVGEALVRHMCSSNQWKPAENFEENVRKLRERKFIDQPVESALVLLWEKRDDYHHLNPTVVRDRADLEELALVKIRALGEVERFAFAWGPSDTPGVIKLLRPQYWPSRSEGRVGMFLRNPSV
ncbi:MAG: hypothetical protein AB7G23_08935 [Vicinamibacterales bacterium]